MSEPTKADMERFERLRNLAIEAVNAHANSEHAGDHNCYYPIYVIANLAHAVGLYSTSHMENVAQNVYHLHLHCPRQGKHAPKEPGMRKDET